MIINRWRWLEIDWKCMEMKKKKFMEMAETGQKLAEMFNYCWQGLETVGNGLNCMEIWCNTQILYELLTVATFGKIMPGKVKITGNCWTWRLHYRTPDLKFPPVWKTWVRASLFGVLFFVCCLSSLFVCMPSSRIFKSADFAKGWMEYARVG